MVSCDGNHALFDEIADRVGKAGWHVDTGVARGLVAELSEGVGVDEAGRLKGKGHVLVML